MSRVVRAFVLNIHAAADDDSEDAGVMRRIFKIGILDEHVAKNPAQYVETTANGSDFTTCVTAY
jgi:hypothetical protein